MAPPREQFSALRNRAIAGLGADLDIKDGYHWPVIACPSLPLHHARRGARGERLAGEDVVQPPADVALPHVAPRRPPGEEISVVGLKRAMHIDETMAEDALHQLALVGPLPRDVWFPLFRMDVHVREGDVQVAAENERLPGNMNFRRERIERFEEAHLRREVFPAVRHIDRRDGDGSAGRISGKGKPRRHDAVFVIEFRMVKGGTIREARPAHVEGELPGSSRLSPS